MKSKELCTHYDDSVDSALILFEKYPRSARTEALDESRFIDYAEDGHVVMVELHEVSSGVDLTGLPSPERIGRALGELAGARGWTNFRVRGAAS